ncbi:hypothetical protein AB0D08_00140 [Kitasatospora sp. NPDC048540]|uniref:hypothetical protein n=1 Tax=Kitasatospora sp. NPDC048540 TaxID=3155634 RepID=UPI0033C87AA2
MTDQENTPPAVWDPTARGGAGGWVRRRTEPGAPAQPPAPPAVPSGFPSGFGSEVRPGFPPQQAPAAFPAPGADPFGGEPTTVLPPVTGAADAPPLFRSPAPPSGPPTGFPEHVTPHPAPHPGGYPAPPGPPHGGAFPGPDGSARPPFPGGFGGPPQPSYPPPGDHPGPGEDEPPRGRTPLFIALGVALVVVIGVGVTWAVRNSGTDSADRAGQAPAATAGQQPPPQSGTTAPAPGASAPAAASPSSSAGPAGAGPNAAAQATALDALLAQAENARSGIGSAVAKVRSCPAKPDTDAAVAVFDSGAQQRDQLIAALAKLDLGDLPGGPDLAKTLNAAWQQSGDIDRAYAAWGRVVSAQGCVNGTAPSTADYKRAGDLNPQATQSKNDFAGKWKPIAEAYGLTPRTADRI